LDSIVKNRANWLLVWLATLLILGGLNVYRQITWKEPTDGVVWAMKEGRLTAIKVDKEGPALYIKKGDVLYSVTHALAPGKILVQNKIDLLQNLWKVWKQGQKITYEIYREGEVSTFSTSLFPGKKGANYIYFYLALIGLTTIIIALIVYLNSARPMLPTNVHFYLLSGFLYMFYVFSFTGEFDLLDSLLYGLDKAAFLVFPPLLLHYFLIFPQRKKFLRERPSAAVLLYIPGLILFLAKIILFLPIFRGLDSTQILQLPRKVGPGPFRLLHSPDPGNDRPWDAPPSELHRPQTAEMDRLRPGNRGRPFFRFLCPPVRFRERAQHRGRTHNAAPGPDPAVLLLFDHPL
jgi:hypothetical protein